MTRNDEKLNDLLETARKGLSISFNEVLACVRLAALIENEACAELVALYGAHALDKIIDRKSDVGGYYGRNK